MNVLCYTVTHLHLQYSTTTTSRTSCINKLKHLHLHYSTATLSLTYCIGTLLHLHLQYTVQLHYLVLLV